jgi:hypothetical protein
VSDGLGQKQRQLLNDFVRAMKDAAGPNLLSIVLYGSAAAHDYSSKHSDMNLLVIVQELDPAALDKAAPVLRWWGEQHQPTSLLLSIEELRAGSDVFAIELLDIQQQHELLFGTDMVGEIEVPLKFHRLQIERELRTAIIRLRQQYVSAVRKQDKLLQLMVDSSSTFHILFRHTLIAMGETPPRERNQVLNRLGAALQIDVAAIRTLVDLREGRISKKDVDIPRTFAGYLRALYAAVDAVDRQLPR